MDLFDTPRHSLIGPRAHPCDRSPVDWTWIAALVTGGLLAVIWTSRRSSDRARGDASAPSPDLAAAPTDVEAQIQQALTDGQKINAIKLYRQLHGVGLAEAKHAVEKMEATE